MWKRAYCRGIKKDVNLASTASKEFRRENYWCVVVEIVREKASRVGSRDTNDPAVDVHCGASEEEALKRKAEWVPLSDGRRQME